MLTNFSPLLQHCGLRICEWMMDMFSSPISTSDRSPSRKEDNNIREVKCTYVQNTDEQ